jgi:hypothetical protein
VKKYEEDRRKSVKNESKKDGKKQKIKITIKYGKARRKEEVK